MSNPDHRDAKTAVVDALIRHVPELGFGVVDVVQVAIEDTRCKIAVTTTVPGIDAASICIGKAGARIRATETDLGMDMISIVAYADDITTYLTNAIATHGITPRRIDITDLPARHARLVFDTTTDPTGPSPFARAIGARGSNVRLASKLTGWRIQLCTTACTSTHCNHPGHTSTLAIAS